MGEEKFLNTLTMSERMEIVKNARPGESWGEAAARIFLGDYTLPSKTIELKDTIDHIATVVERIRVDQIKAKVEVNNEKIKRLEAGIKPKTAKNRPITVH